MTAPTGVHFLLACADDEKAVREANERNNCRSTAAQVNVSLPATCQGRLTRSGVNYTPGPAADGVDDPVTVETPIAGINYFDLTGAADDELFMDCTLAEALVRMANTLEPLSITQATRFGTYNYRCVAGIGRPSELHAQRSFTRNGDRPIGIQECRGYDVQR